MKIVINNNYVQPKGKPTTAYQAIRIAGDGSVERAKLTFSMDQAKRDVIALGAGHSAYDTRDCYIHTIDVYDKGISGASDAGERASMATKRKMVKAKPKKKIVVKRDRPAPRKAKAPSANGHAAAALDLAALKGGSHISGTFKGKAHTATIVHEGERPVVLYRGKQYKSLSAAARAVIVATDGESSGSRVNGRTFWRPA